MSQEPVDLYAVLEVAPTATEEEIKAAYRRLAMLYHPDRNPGDEAAAETFRRVSEAYAVLSDPARRSRYDTTGDASTSPDLKESVASQRLYGTLVNTVAEAYQQGRDLRQTDLLARMKETLRRVKRVAENGKEDAAKATQVWEEVAGRFSSEEEDGQGPNLLQRMAQGRAEECRRSEEAAAGELELLDLCLSMLAGQKYRTDGAEQEGRARASSNAYGFLSTTSW